MAISAVDDSRWQDLWAVDELEEDDLDERVPARFRSLKTDKFEKMSTAHSNDWW
jgi:hypothetical protein